MEKEIAWIHISQIKPYTRNIKTHLIDEIKKSILNYGFVNPIIVDENYVILAGHGRYYACSQLIGNITEKDLEGKSDRIKDDLQKINSGFVKVIIVKGLTEEQKKEYRIVDNILTIKGGIKEFDLTKELAEIRHPIPGFTEEEINELLEKFGLITKEEIKQIIEEVIPKEEQKIEQKIPEEQLIENVVENPEEIVKEELEEQKLLEQLERKYLEDKKEEQEEQIEAICPYCGARFFIPKHTLLWK